ncbi:MAG: right-handed parallel beta-helix repeat-containing protein, partial [Candidatus Aenigmarchaeota archaeon]|nr:right-handed parallel beta-helix repeat-containing protein [Candidatus Aenigmarchaeota archaeon]
IAQISNSFKENTSDQTTKLGGVVNIDGTANGTSFANYSFYYGNGLYPDNWSFISIHTTPVSNSNLISWNTEGVFNGQYTIKLAVNDTDNIEYIDYVVVQIDNRPQVITINSPQNISYDSPEILFDVSLNMDAHTQECAFSIDGQENISMNRYYHDYSLLYTDISKGQHNVVFSCTDKYGISNATQPLWFGVSAETISGCSVLDKQDTAYYLISDIIDSSENTCINITAENVTIDCQNHIVDGINTADTYGIYTNQDDTTISNCQLSDWYYGIHLNSSLRNSINGNTLKDNVLYGISLLDTSLNTIYNNLFNSTSGTVGGILNFNNWNTSIKDGERVYGLGSQIGGNYYTNPTGTGYSDTCTDSDEDGFCDSSYTVDTGNVDYLPLSDQCKHIRISSCQTLDIEGMHYNLTSDVSAYRTCFTVNATNITLNCEGYTINGLPYHSVYGRSYYGIYSYGNTSTNAVIENCVIKDWYYGIFMYYTDHNSVLNSDMNSNRNYGIYSYSSNNNNIEGNNISANNYGIYSYSSNNNNIEGNNISANNYVGVYLASSNNNEIIENNIFDNRNIGMYISYSSGGNKLRSNHMSGNLNNLNIYASTRSNFINDIDTSNTVDGKPVYYWVNQQDKVIPADAGFVGLINSDNITVMDLTLSNNGPGLLLSGTDNSRIKNIISSNNSNGMYFYYSNNNKIEHIDSSHNNCGLSFVYSDDNSISNSSMHNN